MTSKKDNRNYNCNYNCNCNCNCNCNWLFDGEFGVVAVASDDGVLLRFAFFVLHA